MKRDISIATSSAVLGAIGLAAAGPIGGVVGASAGPILHFAGEASLKRAKVFWDSFFTTLDELSISVDDWEQAVTSDEFREEIVLSVFQSTKMATRSADFAALGQVAAEAAVAAPSELETKTILSQMLVGLGSSHLKVLAFIRRIEDAEIENDTVHKLGVTPDEIIQFLEEGALVARSLVRTLELHGLIVDEARLVPDNKNVYWKTTELGVSVLNLIDWP